MIKVSVTVPVYNTSKYLAKCLDSLSSQTLSEIEFILVDDGSTDESPKICDYYAQRDTRFRVIHQQNMGSAGARQTGLNASKGEYVIVCDSDDWVSPNMYESLYGIAINKQADIAICRYFSVYSDGKQEISKYYFNSDEGIVDNYSLLEDNFTGSWVQLIKRSFIQKLNISYDSGINLGEDYMFFYKLMKHNPRISYLDMTLYHYRRRICENTYTNNIRMVTVRQFFSMYEWVNNNYSGEEYEKMKFQLALRVAFLCLRAKDTDNKFLRKFLKSELSWRRLLRHNITLKSILIMGEKTLPLRINKMIYRTLYPFFYK